MKRNATTEINNPSDASDGSARLEAMKAQEREAGRIWCSLCKTYGSHYSSECPTPLGMVAPNAAGERPEADHEH